MNEHRTSVPTPRHRSLSALALGSALGLGLTSLFGGCPAESENVTVAGAGGSFGVGNGGQGGGDPTCSEQPCKLLAPQCGCPTGEHCMNNDSVRSCQPATGEKSPSDSCSGNECAAGSVCADNLTGAPMMCHQYCYLDEHCEAPGGACQLQGGVGLCTHNCDPLTATGCLATGTKCDATLGADMVPHTLCTGAGDGVQGDLCVETSECAEGLGCLLVTGQADKSCLTWCDVADPVCPENLDCENFDPALTIGDIEYGVCT
jgi:hypothetical protein